MWNVQQGEILLISNTCAFAPENVPFKRTKFFLPVGLK
jgi:hypothetical protein